MKMLKKKKGVKLEEISKGLKKCKQEKLTKIRPKQCRNGSNNRLNVNVNDTVNDTVTVKEITNNIYSKLKFAQSLIL
jgi:hypothetical protein